MWPFMRKPISDAFCKGAGPLVLGLLFSVLGGSAAQASEPVCITAGRLNAQGQWAPKLDAIRLLDAAGRTISSASQADMKNVQTLEITQPALLSACEGDRPLTSADGSQAQPKAPVPAAKPGRLAVLGLSYPPLRVGGVLVEVKVRVPADQIVMVMR